MMVGSGSHAAGLGHASHFHAGMMGHAVPAVQAERLTFCLLPLLCTLLCCAEWRGSISKRHACCALCWSRGRRQRCPPLHPASRSTAGGCEGGAGCLQFELDSPAWRYMQLTLSFFLRSFPDPWPQLTFLHHLPPPACPRAGCRRVFLNAVLAVQVGDEERQRTLADVYRLAG